MSQDDKSRRSTATLRFTASLGESWAGWPDYNTWNGVIFRDVMHVRETDASGHATGRTRPIAHVNHCFVLMGNTTPDAVLTSCDLMDPRQLPAQQAATALQFLISSGMLIDAARWAIEQVKAKAGGDNDQRRAIEETSLPLDP